MPAADKIILETALEGVELRNIKHVLDSEDVNEVLQEAYVDHLVEEQKKLEKRLEAAGVPDVMAKAAAAAAQWWTEKKA